MRNRIVGATAAARGGGILVYSLVQGGPQGQGAYATGQAVGMAFGAVLLIARLYYLVKGGGRAG